MTPPLVSQILIYISRYICESILIDLKFKKKVYILSFFVYVIHTYLETNKQKKTVDYFFSLDFICT